MLTSKYSHLEPLCGNPHLEALGGVLGLHENEMPCKHE